MWFKMQITKLVHSHTKIPPMHLVWGATTERITLIVPRLFQSTHLVWGATYYRNESVVCWAISIHAPRVRCDKLLTLKLRTHYYFNPRTSCEVRPDVPRLAALFTRISIHAPRVRCDFFYCIFFHFHLIFQSTHLVWGATSGGYHLKIWSSHFNPRTSCEVRPPIVHRLKC